jgi:hypothetical protein
MLTSHSIGFRKQRETSEFNVLADCVGKNRGVDFVEHLVPPLTRQNKVFDLTPYSSQPSCARLR